MKDIKIHKDEDIGLYTILVGGEVEYECLADDEVVEVVEELIKEGAKNGRTHQSNR